MKKIIYSILLLLFLGGNVICLVSCNKLVEVSPPDNKVTGDMLFKTEAGATSAVLGIYAQMSNPGTNICYGAVTIYSGLSSDELSVTNATASADKEFATNTISSNNAIIKNMFWNRAYVVIYQTNACIEKLMASPTLTAQVRNQLIGESKLCRAFVYFNLINLFGDVPYITSSDFASNIRIPRTPVVQVKTQILADLTEACNMLGDSYPTAGPVRPNKYTALALLAKYYLYEQKWKEAENTSSQIIDSKMYNLVSNLNDVFLANSKEAIWQLMPVRTSYNTLEGNAFIPNKSSSAIPNYILSDYLLKAFEKGDKRMTSWTTSKTVAGTTYIYPYKYKVKGAPSSTPTEYYTMFRLAEQYLIRAEARAEQNNIVGAVDDLNMLRNRARDGSVFNGLPALPLTLSQGNVRNAVKQENRIELFCESGHRWFDLIRQDEADATLTPIKSAWKNTSVRYPIPYSELLLNTTLIQNPGYN